jgi:enoyl-CoA hydratase/carnithine racemase
MDFETVIYEKKGATAFITMNRPESLNALNVQMHEDLGAVWADFRDDDDLRIAIITGAGRAFCAGADLKERATLASAGDREADERRRHLAERDPKRFGMPSVHNVHKPIIAAINGFCVGGGHGMAMTCDIRIASTNARFGDVEIKAGQIGRIDMVVRSYPLAVANYLGLTGQIIPAQLAYQWGFVSHLVEPDELMATAIEIADQVLANPPQAVNVYKDVSVEASGLHETRKYLGHAARGVLASQDYVEAVSSFTQKREADYEGR